MPKIVWTCFCQNPNIPKTFFGLKTNVLSSLSPQEVILVKYVKCKSFKSQKVSKYRKRVLRVYRVLLKTRSLGTQNLSQPTVFEIQTPNFTGVFHTYVREIAGHFFQIKIEKVKKKISKLQNSTFFRYGNWHILQKKIVLVFIFWFEKNDQLFRTHIRGTRLRSFMDLSQKLWPVKGFEIWSLSSSEITVLPAVATNEHVEASNFDRVSNFIVQT